jgi:hypothetical protein
MMVARAQAGSQAPCGNEWFSAVIARKISFTVDGQKVDPYIEVIAHP